MPTESYPRYSRRFKDSWITGAALPLVKMQPNIPHIVVRLGMCLSMNAGLPLIKDF